MAKTSDRSAEIAEQMAGLAAVPSAAEPEPEHAARPAPLGRRAERAMPAETPRPDRYPHRLTLTVSTEQKQALAMARATDGVDSTSRLRALLQLWLDDERLRARADKLALADSQRDRQARGRR